MIIDDDSDDSELFCETVHDIHPDIQCISMISCPDALNFLKKSMQLPDLIFLDLNMPRMNGKQCLEELKKNDRLREIPVIIYTTSKIQDDVLETKRLGAFDFITKPFRTTDIRKAILKVLEALFKYHD